MDAYQREVIDFLKDYGATSIEVVSGGKHPRLEFDFRGKECYYTIPATPSDHRASANTVADLKRLLGPPIEEEEREKRRLADMLPEAPDRPTYLGKMACYKGGTTALRLRFILPRGAVEALRLTPGRKINIENLDKDVWHLGPGQFNDPALRVDGNQLIVDSPEAAQKAELTEPFGVTPADYSIVGPAMVVHLHRDKLATVNRALSAGGKRGGEVTKAVTVEPEPAPQVVKVPLDEEPMEHRLRVILASISAAERQTGYRLVKVRPNPEAEPAWLWRAPDIRLF